MTDRQRVFCWFHLVLLAVFLLNKLYAFPSTSTVVSDFLYACGSLRCMCAACASVYTRVCAAAVRVHVPENLQGLPVSPPSQRKRRGG